jgi:hypothetical protein
MAEQGKHCRRASAVYGHGGIHGASPSLKNGLEVLEALASRMFQVRERQLMRRLERLDLKLPDALLVLLNQGLQLDEVGVKCSDGDVRLPCLGRCLKGAPYER